MPPTSPDRGDTILEHHFDVAHVRDLARRVAPQDDEIRLQTFSDPSHRAIVQKSRAIRCRDRNGLFGAESGGYEQFESALIGVPGHDTAPPSRIGTRQEL